jgi:hypothetical protein
VHCAGVGRADPGYLCVYIDHAFFATYVSIFDPVDGQGGASRLGAAMDFSPDVASSSFYGTFAVTAP